jgi:hypothetical protein
MTEENKRKYAFWLRPDTVRLAEEMFSRDNCKSRSEYVEKALLFYTGYISEKDSALFLSRTLTSVMRGMLDDTENRMATLIFKLTVELAITMNVLAAMGDVDDETLRKLRIKCVEDAKRTNGAISFAGVAKAQREGS